MNNRFLFEIIEKSINFSATWLAVWCYWQSVKQSHRKREIYAELSYQDNQEKTCIRNSMILLWLLWGLAIKNPFHKIILYKLCFLFLKRWKWQNPVSGKILKSLLHEQQRLMSNIDDSLNFRLYCTSWNQVRFGGNHTLWKKENKCCFFQAQTCTRSISTYTFNYKHGLRYWRKNILLAETPCLLWDGT